MEQGFTHDNADILLFHGRIKSLLMDGSDGLAAILFVWPERRPVRGQNESRREQHSLLLGLTSEVLLSRSK
jgi:hypothetical protein